jgi:hypothetical protein
MMQLRGRVCDEDTCLRFNHAATPSVRQPSILKNRHYIRVFRAITTLAHARVLLDTNYLVQYKLVR